VRRSVAVQIAGQRYVIRSDADETYVNALARHVDEKISELRQSTRTVSTHHVVILAALNIADDLFRERQEALELKKKVRERTRGVLECLEREARRA
jgi:cell division protein ZapA